MRTGQLLLFSMIMLACINVYAKGSKYTPYIIKKGDNASQILSDHEFSPLYGKAMWVDKILKLNRLTYETAKKLEPGDVIVIPIEMKLFSEKEYKDSIKTMKSSWTKEYMTKALAPKEKNITVSTSYFTKNHQFSQEDVTVSQNVMATLEYKKRKTSTASKYSINPKASASVYTQSNADFESNNSLVAEFTPSTLLTAGFELEDRDRQASLVIEGQYESFSTLDYIGTKFDVTRENLVWLGLGVNKEFNFSGYEIFGSAGYFRGSELNAQKAQAKLGTFIKRHYMLDVFASSTSFELSSDVLILSSGISLGYRF